MNFQKPQVLNFNINKIKIVYLYETDYQLMFTIPVKQAVKYLYYTYKHFSLPEEFEYSLSY